jgi:excisionase family DNA binding protein
MQKSLSIQEAKTILGVGTTKFYQLLNSGDLHARKIGKRTIILRSDLDDFLSNLEAYPSQKKEG